MMDHYKVLGLTKTATKSEIKEAFRRLALKFHPDKHSHSSKPIKDDALRRFKQASEAYEVLIDDRKRADYNFRSHSGSGGYSHRQSYYNHHNRNKSSANYNYKPSVRRFNFDAAIWFLTSRAFLLNLAFAGVLLGGATFIERSGEALWRMQNSGKSFEEAVEAIEEKKRRKDTR